MNMQRDSNIKRLPTVLSDAVAWKYKAFVEKIIHYHSYLPFWHFPDIMPSLPVNFTWAWSMTTTKFRQECETCETYKKPWHVLISSGLQFQSLWVCTRTCKHKICRLKCSPAWTGWHQASPLPWSPRKSSVLTWYSPYKKSLAVLT